MAPIAEPGLEHQGRQPREHKAAELHLSGLHRDRQAPQAGGKARAGQSAARPGILTPRAQASA